MAHAEEMNKAMEIPMVAILMANLINDGGSATFASFIGEVEVTDMAKTGNSYFFEKLGRAAATPLHKVTKVGKYFVRLNSNYKNAVNNALAREGKEATFELKREPWYERIFDGFNGSLAVKKSDRSKYVLVYINDGYDFHEYRVDGRPATAEEVAIITAFRPSAEKKEEQQRAKAEGQGLAEAVNIQAIGIDNIRVLNANNYTFEFNQ